MSEALLTVQNLTMRFGGLTAVNDLSFVARQHEITAVIGPNGAGKTTAFNCITGFYKPTNGTVTIAHEDGKTLLLNKLPGHLIAKKGRVARTFQNIRLFSGMTVLAIVVLGGAGSQLGVVLAAIVMIGVPAKLQDLQVYRMLIFGIALVFIMVVRPRGFISTRRPTVSLGKAKIIGAEMVSEGRG